MNHNLNIIGMKLFGKLLVTTIICFITSLFALSMIDGPFVRLLVQILFLVFVLASIYPTVYKVGSADASAVKRGHRKPRYFSGFIIGMISCIPFIMSAAMLLTSKFNLTADMTVFYRLLNSIYIPFTQSVLFGSLTLAEHSTADVLISLIPQLFIPIMCGIIYLLGYFQIEISEILLFKRHKEE